MSRITIFSCLLVLICSPFPVLGQTPLVERDPPVDVSVRTVVTFGDADGPGFIGEPKDVDRRDSGEWVVVDQLNPTEIKFFSSDGEWIRTIGRKGSGPGEYQIASFVRVLPEDSLGVHDFLQNRFTVYSPELEVCRTITTEIRAKRFELLGDGRIVFASNVSTRESIGLPLHLINASGKLERSFGADLPIRNVSASFSHFRSISPTGRSTVWSAPLTRYVLEEWTLDGDRMRYLERNVPWFEPYDRYSVFNQDHPPTPGIIDIHEDERGLLWVAILLPDPEWEEAFEEGTDLYGRPAMRVHDHNKHRDTRIEVIDPERGLVLGSVTIDERVKSFTRTGELLTHGFREGLFPVVIVLEARLSDTKGDGK